MYEPVGDSIVHGMNAHREILHGTPEASHLVVQRQASDDAVEIPGFPCECREDGRFESRFALRLANLVPDADVGVKAAAYDAFILEHVLAVLEANQTLQFVFRREPGAIRFDVCGRAVASSSADAQTSALALHDTLAHLLAARGDCRFASTQPDAADFLFRYRVQPEGILLTTQRKPTAADKAEVSVMLPAASLVEARVSLWEALLGCTFPVTLTVTVTPVRLDAAAVDGLSKILKALEDEHLRCACVPERHWLNAEQVRVYTGAFATQLKRWLLLTRGVHLDVAISTPEPLREESLRWLVQPMLPAWRFRIAAAQGSVAGGAAGAIDLRNCLNEAAAMPALLPDRQALQKLGLPMGFGAPESPLADSGIVLGETRGQPVRLPDADRERHCYLVGATGCGKSTLLRNLILQDIEAGEGVCLLDPHGDLFQEVLAAIPRRRAKDVILFDPTDFERAMGLNYLEIPGEHPAIERNFVANELMKIFDRLYDMRVAGGPMFETYARNGLLLLMENRIAGLTLVEFPLIFESEAFRKHLIEHCTNPGVVRFWSAQAEPATGEASLAGVAPYITSKFNQFTSNALVRNIIGQSRSTVDFRGVMDRRRILLVNLSKGLLGELDAALLGMLIVSKLFGAALGRARLPRDQRAPFHLYIDEFQNFTTDTIAHLLSEARKFGLRLTLSNQHLTQLDVGHGAGNLVKAVMGNVSTILAMRLGALDADALHGVLGPRLDRRMLQNLPDYHVAARLLQAGRPAAPFVFKTHAPTPATLDETAQAIIRQAYEKAYTRPVTEVEKEIAARS